MFAHILNTKNFGQILTIYTDKMSEIFEHLEMAIEKNPVIVFFCYV